MGGLNLAMRTSTATPSRLIERPPNVPSDAAGASPPALALVGC
jgi:hypothetical protein